MSVTYPLGQLMSIIHIILNNMMKTITAAICCMAGCLSALAEGTANYSNYPVGEDLAWWGSNRAEDYDVAVKIDAPEFVGLDVCGITFHVPINPEVTDFSIWASRTLQLDNKKNAPDIFSTPVSAVDSIISLSFDTPCKVTEEGLYIGYSFSVGSVADESLKRPVAVVRGKDDADNNFYLHTSAAYGKWIDNGKNTKYLVPCEMVLAGLDGEKVTISLTPDLYGAVGKDTPVSATLTNLGYSAVETVTLEYATPSASGKVEVECEGMRAGEFMAAAPVSFAIPASDNIMNGELTVKVTEVNGKPNSADASGNARLEIFSRLPLKTPLMEEYTGTGCGWCPRGAIGIEKMAELYGDRFVAVTYHCDDIMSIFDSDSYPSPAPAQPVAWMDRVRSTDPYLGDNTNQSARFGIDKIWDEMAARFTPADVTLKCDWTDDTHTAIEATAEVNFVKRYEEADFRMVYILLEDGLSGSTPQWMQGNYYSGQTDKWPEEFDFLVNAPQYIVGYVYNDVAIWSTDPAGIAGSLPALIEADSSYSHSMTLNLEEALNLTGESLVQDASKISVVAAMIDANSGEILNCAKAVPGNSAVTSVSDTEILKVEQFNLQGVRTESPAKGSIVIERVTRADGTTSTRKIIAR